MLVDDSHSSPCSRAERLNQKHQQVLRICFPKACYLYCSALFVGVIWSQAVIQRGCAFPSEGQEVVLPPSGTGGLIC